MKNILLMLAVATLTCSAVVAQLNGTYTVDASLPTGSGNYASLAAAAADLVAVGVSGPVTFNVIPNASPYVGFTIAGPITGTSATNTVTFQGAPGTMLSGVAAGFAQVVRLGPTPFPPRSSPARPTSSSTGSTSPCRPPALE